MMPPLAAVTVRDTEVAWVAEGPVPVMVMGKVPGAVALPTVRVKVALPPAVTDDGVNVAVVPLGTPLADRLTDWATPLVTAVVRVTVPVAPCPTERLLGLAA